MSLTDTEHERLRVWSVGVLGFTLANSRGYGQVWDDGKGSWIHRDDWDPLAKLDQAAMVAEKFGSWVVEGDVCCSEGSPIRRGEAEADNPAEALVVVVAAAEACGWKWRD